MLGRSGAGTVTETAIVGLPAIFVPLPHGNGEQAKNGRFLVEAEAAIQIRDADLDADTLVAQVTALVANPERLAHMSRTARGLVASDAADVLARIVLGLADRGV